MKKQKLGKTEPKMEAESKETRLKKIMEFKEQGQKLTEREKSKKVLLKKLQKLRKLGEKPMSTTAMTTVEMEQKETKMELPAVSTIEAEMHKTGKSLLK